MSTASRGQSDHRAVELFERLAFIAERQGRTVDQCVPLITASIIEDAAIRWFTMRGYAMPAKEVRDGRE